MHLEEVRSALHRSPFMPFTLRLVDGTNRYVPHPDFVALGNRRCIIVVDAATEAAAFIDPLMVVSLEYTQTPTPSAPTRNGDTN